MIPYQDVPSPPMTEEQRERCARALHVWTTDGRTLVGEDAVIFVYETLGWPVGFLRWRPFAWFTGPGYRVVASNRPLFARFTFRTRE